MNVFGLKVSKLGAPHTTLERQGYQQAVTQNTALVGFLVLNGAKELLDLAIPGVGWQCPGHLHLEVVHRLAVPLHEYLYRLGIAIQRPGLPAGILGQKALGKLGRWRKAIKVFLEPAENLPGVAQVLGVVESQHQVTVIELEQLIVSHVPEPQPPLPLWP